MSSRFTHLRALYDVVVATDFMQVLISRVQLQGLPKHGLELTIEFDESLPVILKPSEKLGLLEPGDIEEGFELEALCEKLRSEQANEKKTIHLDSFLLRHASGGVFASIGDPVQPEWLLFERDIAPLGWNIANGASGNPEELLAIDTLLQREACEEILFFDPTQKTIHTLAHAGKTIVELEQALQLWCDRLGAQVGHSLSWANKGGPDRAVIRFGEREFFAKDLAITISAEDYGIEYVRPIHIRTFDHLVPLDGELIHGELLDRRVGIFSSHASLKSGIPSRLYRSGQAIPVKDNQTTRHCPTTQKLIDRMIDQA